MRAAPNRLTIPMFGSSLRLIMEKRESERTNFNLKTVVIPKEGGRPIEFLHPNISWGGIGGYTRESAQEGGDVSVRIFFSQRSGETLSEEVFGKIVRARKDGNFIAIGIAFSGLDAASHPKLTSYL